MESVYYVISWLCHRTCGHCYEDRFRPYHGDARERILSQAERDCPRIIANLPASMVYLDRTCGLTGKRGRIILAGGEVLLEPVRSRVLFPALSALHGKYAGGVNLVIQTTGDLLTPAVLDEILRHPVWMVSVSGLDEYHEGIEPRDLQANLTSLFESRGMEPLSPDGQGPGPYFHFFGATPDSWIGKLWPRGRALANELSTAGIEDNFCNRWSGGLNFLEAGYSGSEVSIDPEGNVYPCCIKTRLPIGNLLGETLESVLARLRGNPVYEAISMGQPERMGITRGWSTADFLEKSQITLGNGRLYRNLCIGCDRFHEEVLAPLIGIEARS